MAHPASEGPGQKHGGDGAVIPTTALVGDISGGQDAGRVVSAVSPFAGACEELTRSVN